MTKSLSGPSCLPLDNVSASFPGDGGGRGQRLLLLNPEAFAEVLLPRKTCGANGVVNGGSDVGRGQMEAGPTLVEPGLAPLPWPSAAREAPALWASVGINKKLGWRERQAGKPQLDSRCRRGYHKRRPRGAHYQLCLGCSLLPTQEAFSFLRGHQIFRAEDGRAANRGE